MSSEILTLLFVIPAMLISSSIHEFAHAYSAYLLGDDTARSEGRMTLNPFAHIDLFGFAMMIFGRIGWSKPVPVNSYNFENPALGNLIVSAAGPISNLLTTIGVALLIKLLFVVGATGIAAQILLTFLISMLFVNVSLALFNLIPVPPLDGSNIIEFFLPKRLQGPWASLSQYAPFLLILLVAPVTPLFAIFNSIWYNLLTSVINAIVKLFGITELGI